MPDFHFLSDEDTQRLRDAGLEYSPQLGDHYEYWRVPGKIAMFVYPSSHHPIITGRGHLYTSTHIRRRSPQNDIIAHHGSIAEAIAWFVSTTLRAEES